jgi:hypothetical protein
MILAMAKQPTKQRNHSWSGNPGNIMTLTRLRAAASVCALIVSVQLCLASDARREAAEGWWSLWGEKTKAEVKRLPDAGRRAFREALIACSLYADDYDSADYRAQCQRASKSFVIEFSRDSSAIDLSFKASKSSTAVWSAQVELDRQNGKRDTVGGDTRYMGLDVLQRAYRETGK